MSSTWWNWHHSLTYSFTFCILKSVWHLQTCTIYRNVDMQSSRSPPTAKESNTCTSLNIYTFCYYKALWLEVVAWSAMLFFFFWKDSLNLPKKHTKIIQCWLFNLLLIMVSYWTQTPVRPPPQPASYTDPVAWKTDSMIAWVSYELMSYELWIWTAWKSILRYLVKKVCDIWFSPYLPALSSPHSYIYIPPNSTYV